MRRQTTTSYSTLKNTNIDLKYFHVCMIENPEIMSTYVRERWKMFMHVCRCGCEKFSRQFSVRRRARFGRLGVSTPGRLDVRASGRPDAQTLPLFFSNFSGRRRCGGAPEPPKADPLSAEPLRPQPQRRRPQKLLNERYPPVLVVIFRLRFSNEFISRCHIYKMEFWNFMLNSGSMLITHN